MKPVYMEETGMLQSEMNHLKRSIKLLKYAVLALGFILIVLLITFAAVAGSQGNRISGLVDRKGIISHPTVGLVSGSAKKNIRGLTYGGSLFRGSGFWTLKPSLPNKLSDHAAIGVDPEEVIYIIGGALENGNVTANVWKYDAIFRNYTRVSPMPQPRYRFGAALLNGKIYVVGGRNDSSPLNSALVKSTFIYDIKTDKWTQGAEQIDYHGDTCAANLDGKIYIAGGYGFDYSYLNTVEVYDPVKNVWSKVASMPTPRGDLMCAGFMNELYVLGGYYDPTNKLSNAFVSAMESYNPVTQRWTKRPDMLTPRGDAAVMVLPGNKLMLVGGEGHYRDNETYKYPKHVNEVYFGDDETWVQKAMIPTPRFRTAGAVIGGIAYVFGGAALCIGETVCPIQNNTEIFLDMDHPHVYIYLRNEAYNDDAPLTTYPL